MERGFTADKHIINYDNQVVAELYDMHENYTEDVEFINKLIQGMGKLNILECFTGTGRIFLPLLKAGHKLTGIELAGEMLDRAKAKLRELDKELQGNAVLIHDDILQADWGTGYQLIIIGCNAFYELPSPDIQEACIKRAYEALTPGGYLFIDNNDYKGNWGSISCEVERVIFEGTLSDGSHAQMILKHDHFDEGANILDFTHKVIVKAQDGTEQTFCYSRRKHPVTAKEVRSWLDKYHFRILNLFGDIEGNPYNEESQQAIFWVRKEGVK